MCTWRESKGTKRVGSLILECSQHLVEPLKANLCQKPLDVCPRQAFVGFEAKAGVLHNHSSADLEGMELLPVGPGSLGSVLQNNSSLICGCLFMCHKLGEARLA